MIGMEESTEDIPSCEFPRESDVEYLYFGALWVGAIIQEGDSTFPRVSVGQDGWVNTNDLFREDEEGYFWYAGRADDLLKVSGVYVAPLEIEECLEKHPSVKECVVLGLEDADGLMKTKAFIALDDGVEQSDELTNELKAFCKENLAPYKSPKVIEFLEELPKTGQGKIDKRKLRERES